MPETWKDQALNEARADTDEFALLKTGSGAGTERRETRASMLGTSVVSSTLGRGADGSPVQRTAAEQRTHLGVETPTELLGTEVVSSTFGRGADGSPVQRTEAEQRDHLGVGMDLSHLGVLANRLRAGTATSIGVWGDSVHAGYLYNGGSPITANPTCVQTMQTALRDYYGNSAATTVNHATSGYGTSDVIATWTATMAASTDDVIWIGYCINDFQGATSPAITGAQYAANLRTMVRAALRVGKIVVLETPPPTLDYGVLGTEAKAHGVRQFAAIMRRVAAELGVGLVDSHRTFGNSHRGRADPLALNDDGIHITQAGQVRRGYSMALAVTGAIAVSGPGYVGAAHPAIRMTGTPDDIVAASGSAYARGRIANRITVPVWVEAGGLDLYLAVPYWSSGATAAALKIDDQTVATLSLNVAGTGSAFFVDREIMVARDLKPGAYLVTLQGDSTNQVGLYSVRATPTVNVALTGGASTGTTPTIRTQRPGSSLRMVTAGDASGQNHMFGPDVMSNMLFACGVSFTATLAGNTGVSFFGSATADGSYPRAGYTAYLDNTTGYLTVATATSSSYSGGSAVGSTDLRGVAHRYEFAIATNGDIACYVDGALVGTYTPPGTIYRGGRFGLYAAGANQTVDVTDVRFW